MQRTDGSIEMEETSVSTLEKKPINTHKLSNKIKSRMRRNKKFKKRCITILILFILLSAIVFFDILKPDLIPSFFGFLQKSLNHLYKDHKIIVLTLMAVILFIDILLVLPVTFPIYFLISLTINNEKQAFLFLYSIKIISSVLIFYITKKLFYECVREKLFKNNVYQVLKDESKLAPWRIAFLTRLMSLPAGLKDYILALIGINFRPYIVAALVENIFFILQVVFLARNVTEMNDYLTKHKSWSDKDTLSKIFWVVQVLLVIMSVALFCVLSWKITKKMKDKKRKDENKEINAEDEETTELP